VSALRELIQGVSNAFKWWVIIAPWEQALRIRGGKHAKLLNPGVHFRVPFWDRVYIQPVRIRITSSEAQTLETADGKVLSIQLLISFRVSNLLLLYENIHAPEDTVLGFAMGVASELIQATPARLLTPASLSSAVLNGLERLVGGYGLADLGVSVSNFVYVPRAYRLITGGLTSAVYGGQVDMAHDRENR
jgi:hypothetical protein